MTRVTEPDCAIICNLINALVARVVQLVTTTSAKEVVSSILVKTKMCILASVAENMRTRVSKIQPSVDELQKC